MGGSAAGARAADPCVDSFPSIQAAIGAANDGDVVRVPVGRYTETLVITESITLQGGWDSGCSIRATADPAQTVIDGNRAGSVIQLTGGAPTLEALTITGGWSSRGAGIYALGGSPTLTHVNITGNTISTTIKERTYGAGLYVWASSIVLDHTDIVSNVAYAYAGQMALGGGVYVHGVGEPVELVATRIMSNVSAGGASLHGAGLFLNDGGVVALDGGRSIIAHNAGNYGAGIYMYAPTTVSGIAILSNTAAVLGGGVYVTRGHGGSIANTVIAGNSAGSEGDGVFIWDASLEIANNTIVGNEGSAGIGVDIHPAGTPVITLTNNIIAGHMIGIRNQHPTVSPTLLTNDVWDNELNYEGVLTGTTDVHVDPQFVDAAGGDYHLADGSPLIDAGTTVEWLGRDFDGDPRPIGIAHDIGADEFARFVYVPLVMRAHAP